MPRLILEVERCSSCPYADINKAGTGVECWHPETMAMYVDQGDGIPDWCPLPEEEDKPQCPTDS